MDEPTVLRTTKIGGGFVKEDVLTYLDELNTKISNLEEELKAAKENGPADPQELITYRNQVENLQEKLNASNNALRAAKKENEELQKKVDESEKIIAQLKAGGAAPAAAAAGNGQMNAQAQAALEAAKKEIDSLRNQLKASNDKLAAAEKAAPGAAAAPAAAAANAQVTAALETAKKEIDSLRDQLKTANDKLAAAEKAAADKPAASNAAPAGNPAAEAELAKAKQEIEKLNADLKSKSAELEAKIKEASDNESKIADLTKAKENAVSEAVAKKDEEITNLNKEIAELKANANNPAAMMGTLFAEAQKTVDALKKQAEIDAEITTRDAKEKADRVVAEAQINADKAIKEANITAEKTVKEANETAELTVAKANIAAEKAIKEANAQAKNTVDDANTRADKINAMSSTVRLMLINEIESVNTKFSDIKDSMARLTSQATDKMNEAQNLIGEARNSIEPEDKATIERAEAPQAEFEAAKVSLGTAALLETPEVKEPVSRSNNNANNAAKAAVADEAFARVSGGSYNNGGSFSNNSKPAHNNANPSNNNAAETKAASKKNNFSFDMSDLLKAAEEEAAKDY